MGGRSVHAVRAYEFKESDILADKFPVYNAAVNYDKGGKLDKAIETRRYLINNFPKSPLVPDTLYNIAESYERVADFAQAAATELETRLRSVTGRTSARRTL